MAQPEHPDLAPAARRVADLVRGVHDEQLAAPTPCPNYALGDLVDHVGGLALAFTAAATKAVGGASSLAPSGDASRLGDDWRTRIPRDLVAMAAAWADPAAWDGMTEAGGLELPGAVAGLVALDELVLHGWDVARSVGAPYEPSDAELTGAKAFLDMFSGPGTEDQRGEEFGPERTAPAGAPLLDVVVAQSGRDPGWSAA